MKKVSKPETDTAIARWRADPCTFIEENLYDPQTAAPFALYAEQKKFLRTAFQRTPAGQMKFTEQCFSGPKKSGKTGLAAMIIIYTAVVLAGNGGEIYCLANDREQAESRVFKAVGDILRASPRLRDSATIGQRVITFKATNTTVKSVANDYSGFSGANPTLNVYDELAYYVGENSKRLWDEGIPSPARKISFRLSVSTAGFDGESSPLRDLYDRMVERGKRIAPDLKTDGKLLIYWATKCKAPWQSRDWIQEQRSTFSTREHQFARLIENAWVSAIDVFIPMEDWDACVDPDYSPVRADPRLDVWVGLDASVSRDSTAIVACAWDPTAKKVKLVRHKVFQPTKKNPLDFERCVEGEILDLRQRFRIRQVLFDPWQLVSVSQRLGKLGVPMEAYNQTSGNLTETGSTLLELVKYHNLILYPDADMRVAVSRCIAKESGRGWKITKAVASHKIDSVVALSLAALGATRGGQTQSSGNIAKVQLDAAAVRVRAGATVEQAAAATGLGVDEVTRWIDRQRTAPARMSALALSRPPADEVESWENARKLVAAGATIAQAVDATAKSHRTQIIPEALTAYIARVDRQTGPSRPRFAPGGSQNPFN